MKKILLTLVLSLLAARLPAAVNTPLQAREQRVNILAQEIKSTDALIERRIDLIVEKLSALVDSKESRAQISEIKKQTIEGLTKTMEQCQRRRAALVEEIRNPRLNLTTEQKQEIMSVLDTRIEKRIDQILTLQKSFPDASEAGKYRTGNTGYSNDWVAHKAAMHQNTRMVGQSDTLRRQVSDALNQSIRRLESQNITLRQKAAANPNPAQRDLINLEISRNNALIATREKQLVETYDGSGTNARAVGRNEAVDINKLLVDMDKDLRADFNTLFQRYSEYLPALADLNTTRAATVSHPQTQGQ